MDSPMLEATLQAGGLSGLSNILGQLIGCYQSNVLFSISPTELTHFIIFALFSTPPNYVWQSWLEAQFPGYVDRMSAPEKENLVDVAVTGRSTEMDNDNNLHKRRSLEKKALIEPAPKRRSQPTPTRSTSKLNYRNTAIKFALDQTLGAAVNTLLFIAGIALLRGQGFEEIRKGIEEQFWPMIFAGQKLWPAVSVLSFTVIPMERRTLFGSVVGLFWGIYLSLMSGAKK